MKKHWIRNLVGGLSFTTALFVFQACYGTPQDFGLDVFVEGKVVSGTTGKPIQGIKVSAASLQHTVTDEVESDNLQIRFEDIDGTVLCQLEMV